MYRQTFLPKVLTYDTCIWVSGACTLTLPIFLPLVHPALNPKGNGVLGFEAGLLRPHLQLGAVLEAGNPEVKIHKLHEQTANPKTTAPVRFRASSSNSQEFSGSGFFCRDQGLELAKASKATGGLYRAYRV